MVTIDTRLLVIGHGPAALVVAKTVAGRGLPCLVAGHEPIGASAPVELNGPSIAALTPHGVLDVLRPYATAQDPFAIAPIDFELGLKHHCVADMLITVYDRMTFIPARTPTATPTDDADSRKGPDHGSVQGELSDGSSRWEVRADALFDADCAPDGLNEAVSAATDFAADLVDSLARRAGER